MPRKEEIVDAAREILEAGGREALTMRRLGERLGIRAPSLYKHFAGREELDAALSALALEEIAAALAGSESLEALARSYRRWARAHPHLYRLTTEQPLARDLLPEGLEARAAAPILAAMDGDLDRARAVWAFAHGMVELELAGRFPPDADLDAAWAAGIEALRPAGESPVPPRVRPAVVASFTVD